MYLRMYVCMYVCTYARMYVCMCTPGATTSVCLHASSSGSGVSGSVPSRALGDHDRGREEVEEPQGGASCVPTPG